MQVVFDQFEIGVVRLGINRRGSWVGSRVRVQGVQEFGGGTIGCWGVHLGVWVVEQGRQVSSVIIE